MSATPIRWVRVDLWGGLGHQLRHQRFHGKHHDIAVGTVTSHLLNPLFATVNTATGQIGIATGERLPTTVSGPGSLVIITFHVNTTPRRTGTISLPATQRSSGQTVTTASMPWTRSPAAASSAAR